MPTLEALKHETVDLHPAIQEHSAKLYETRQFDDAVFNAFKFVETSVRLKSGLAAEDIGTSLVSKATNAKAPILRFSDVDREQDAFHALYRGAIGAFKNPHSHRFLYIKDSQRTLDLLRFASLLLKLLENATVVHQS